MLLDLLAIAFFLSGLVLIVRWIVSAIQIRATEPAPNYSFTIPAMRDRRRRQRSGLYLGAGLLCVGAGLFFSGMAVQV